MTMRSVRSVLNPNNTLVGLQENIAIVSTMVMDEHNQYIKTVLSIDEACQIGQMLWDAGYRKTMPEIIYEIQELS